MILFLDRCTLTTSISGVLTAAVHGPYGAVQVDLQQKGNIVTVAFTPTTEGMLTMQCTVGMSVSITLHCIRYCKNAGCLWIVFQSIS